MKQFLSLSAIVVALFAFVMIVSGQPNGAVQCPADKPQPYYMRDFNDCAYYFECSNGATVAEHKRCEIDFFWSQEDKVTANSFVEI